MTGESARVPYLIDAANLGGALGGAAGARDAEAVVHLLLPWARGRRAIAVFDGADPGLLARHYDGLEVVWSGAGRSADDEIVRRATSGRGRYTVVSDDAGLLRRCRGAARLMGVAELLERIAPRAATPAGAEKPERESDPERWARLFAARRDEPQ